MHVSGDVVPVTASGAACQWPLPVALPVAQCTGSDSGSATGSPWSLAALVGNTATSSHAGRGVSPGFLGFRKVCDSSAAAAVGAGVWRANYYTISGWANDPDAQ